MIWSELYRSETRVCVVVLPLYHLHCSRLLETICTTKCSTEISVKVVQEIDVDSSKCHRIHIIRFFENYVRMLTYSV